MSTPTSRFARAVISAMLIFGSAGPAGWTGAVGIEPACDAAPGDVGDCAVWAAAPAMPSNRTATKARAIPRNRSIIGCPPTGNSLNRRLTVDGVDNKANGRFCRLGCIAMAQAGGHPLPQSGVPSGAIRVRMRVLQGSRAPFWESRLSRWSKNGSTMHHAKQQAQANAPFLKTALVLWVLALCGVFLVLPYVATLENSALAAAAARAHLEVRELLAISVAQT